MELPEASRQWHKSPITWVMIALILLLLSTTWIVKYAIFDKMNYEMDIMPGGNRHTITRVLWNNVIYDVVRAPIIRHFIKPKSYYHAFDVSGNISWRTLMDAKMNRKRPFEVRLNLSEPICTERGTIQRAVTKTDANGNFRFFFGACNRPDVEYTLEFRGPYPLNDFHRKECDKRPIVIPAGLSPTVGYEKV